ncbi:MAG: hypothetical protein EAS48_09995 [Chryseobacterium sp.]|nr:MAG: hypothetical protein EAS48_09995 [Chryseobacterium sp.]
MDIAAEKKEIIAWINSLENPVILDRINKIRKAEFDFEKEWKLGISIDEARKRSAAHIKSLPWKR